MFDKNVWQTLRFTPAVRALIPPEACMGFPFALKEDLFYIPFFNPVKENECVQIAEIIVTYPELKMHGYRKINDGKTIVFDEKEFFEGKQRFDENYLDKAQIEKMDMRTFMECIPEAFAEIYQSAGEVLTDEKCNSDL